MRPKGTMQEMEQLNGREKRKVSPLIFIVGGIIAISGLFLLLPSSRSSKALRAKAKLSKDFAGPKDISYLYTGVFVSSDSLVPKISKTDEYRIYVFAPGPKDTIPSDFFSEVRAYRYSGRAESSLWTCLLAPDPACTNWTLFSKVWLAEQLQKSKSPPTDFEVLAGGVQASSPPVLSEIKTRWTSTPAKIRTEAEAILARNREIVKGLPGLHRYYQDGAGVNYEIGPTSTVWDFDRTIEDSRLDHPHR